MGKRHDFRFLESEAFSEVGTLSEQKQHLSWTVVGHIAEKLVATGGLSGEDLEDADAANKLTFLKYHVLPSLLADFHDLHTVWENRLSDMLRKRNTALGAA